jgi:hypothetical protein
MTRCAESQHKKQHGSDGAAGCGSDEATQIHRLNNPKLDKVQAPPHYLLTFLATTAKCIFNLQFWLICIYLCKMFQLSFTMHMSKVDEIYQSDSDICHLEPSC